MRDLLTTLVERSVSMSVFALGLIFLTPLLSKRYASKWLYYCWLVIVVGLIIPLRFHFHTILIPIDVAPFSTQQVVHDNIGTIANTTININEANHILSTIQWYQIVGILWIAGIIVFLIYHILRHYRFIRMVMRWGEQTNDTTILEVLKKIKSDMGISKQVKLLICSFISSPMMIGFLNPTIILPRSDFSADELSYILQHELVHFKRRDLWYKSLVFFATAIHWFNPIVYLIARVIASQCELSCDAKVINGKNIESRQRYSETILGVIKYQSRLQTVFSTNFYGGKKGMKKRIFSIMDTSKKKTGGVILCLVLAGALGTGVVFASNTPAVSGTQKTYVITEDDKAQTAKDIPTKKELLSQYGEYGISFNSNGKMYFNNELVRYFWDGVELDDNISSVYYEYLNEEGTVDVYTTRKVIDNGDGSVNPFGELTGIMKCSQEEFKKRNLDDLKDSSNQVTCYDNSDEVIGETFTQKFAKYEDVGIEFKEQQGSGRGNVYYNGQLVRTFIDEKNNGGIFTYQSADGGDIIVHTIYDENGKLIGVEKSKK